MSPLSLILCLLLLTGACLGRNLSCYQCVRHANEECKENELVPCSNVFDRCVTHISKDDRRGYIIKRECGLGPCAFEDDMVNRGLGLDGCDRSKDEFFCVSCCRTSGCNKSEGSWQQPSNIVTAATVLSGLFLVFHRQ